MRSRDLAFNAAVAEAAGDDNAVEQSERISATFSSFTVSESIHLISMCAAVDITGMTQRLRHREVGVVQLYIFADKSRSSHVFGRL